MKHKPMLGIFLLVVLAACQTNREPIVTELIANGGFETLSNWKYSNTGATRGTKAYCTNSGNAYGELSTQGEFNDPEISQFIVMPTQGKTTLEFSVRVDTSEAAGTSANSLRLFVGYGEAVVGATVTTGDVRNQHFTKTVDITNRKGTAVEGGQEIEVYFKADFKGSKPSTFCIDDVSVKNVR